MEYQILILILFGVMVIVAGAWVITKFQKYCSPEITIKFHENDIVFAYRLEKIAYLPIINIIKDNYPTMLS